MHNSCRHQLNQRPMRGLHECSHDVLLPLCNESAAAARTSTSCHKAPSPRSTKRQRLAFNVLCPKLSLAPALFFKLTFILKGALPFVCVFPVPDSEVVYRNVHGHVVKFNVALNQSEILLSNSTFVSGPHTHTRTSSNLQVLKVPLAHQPE